MQFQLNSDSNVQGDERLAEIAEQIALNGLGNLVPRLTRVEVHLQKLSPAKGGLDAIRCMIEARPEGMKPQSVTGNGATVEAALKGAIKKLHSLLDSQFGRLSRRRTTESPE